MMYAVGDRVRVRDWNDLAAEFGFNHQGLTTPYKIPNEHRGLCGSEATVISVEYSKQKRIWKYDLADFDSGGRDLGFRENRPCPVYFSEEMLGPLKGDINSIFNKQVFFKMLGVNAKEEHHELYI